MGVTPEAPFPEKPGPRLGAEELQSRAISGIAWTLISVLVSLPVAFAVNIALARILGVSQYGQLAFLTAALTMAVGVVDIGTSAALVQFGSKAHAVGHVEVVAKLLSRTQGFRLLLVAPVLTLFVIFTIHVDIGLLLMTIVFGVWVPAGLGGLTDCLIVENKAAAGAKVVLSIGLITQAAVLTAAYWFRAADAVWATRLLVSGLVPLVAIAVISPVYRVAVLRPQLPRTFPQGFWKFAIPTAIAGLVGELVVSRSEVFMLKWLSTPHAVGIFALAFGLASHVFAPANALTNPLIPAISSLHAVRPEMVREAFLRVLRVGSLATAAMLISVVPALAILLTSIYGNDYDGATTVLLVLGVAGALTTLSGPVTTFVYARLSARKMLGANIAALAVDVGIAVALVPTLGVWGAVLANIAAAATRLALLTRYEISQLHVSWSSLCRPTAALLSAILLLAPIWLLADHVSAHPVVAAIIAAILGPALLLAALRLSRSGLTHGDRDAILRSLPERLRTPGARALTLVTIRS